MLIFIRDPALFLDEFPYLRLDRQACGAFQVEANSIPNSAICQPTPARLGALGLSYTSLNRIVESS
jgi:hypothetical protein